MNANSFVVNNKILTFPEEIHFIALHLIRLHIKLQYPHLKQVYDLKYSINRGVTTSISYNFDLECKYFDKFYFLGIFLIFVR